MIHPLHHRSHYNSGFENILLKCELITSKTDPIFVKELSTPQDSSKLWKKLYILQKQSHKHMVRVNKSSHLRINQI